MLDFLCNIWKVEHGSCAYVQTKNNKRVLMDAGRSDSFSPSEHISANWDIKKIDKLIVSHPHRDHIQDLPTLLDLIDVRSRVWNNHTPERLVYPSGKRNLAEPLSSWQKMSDTFTETISDDEAITNSAFFEGVQFNIFGAKESQLPSAAKENINNYSLLTTISYRGLVIVFPGDLEPDGWDAILDNTNLSSHLTGDHKILIAPHHGRSSGIKRNNQVYSRFLDIFKPNLTVISDKWGSETTDPEAYRPYCSGMNVECEGELQNKKILTTKTNDCVTIKIDGNSLIVKV